MAIKRYTDVGGEGGSRAEDQALTDAAGRESRVVYTDVDRFVGREPFVPPRLRPPPPREGPDDARPAPLPGLVEPTKHRRGAPPPTSFIAPNVAPQAYSVESAYAPFETLFRDFDLAAIPFYNFWTEDEEENDREPRGDRKLDEIPRFIKVVWRPAPDMAHLDPLGGPANGVLLRSSRPVKIGVDARRAPSVGAGGIAFSPDHLRPENFALVRRSLANGHVGPGVVEAVVDMSLRAAGIGPPPGRLKVDEEAFLAHPDSRGLSYHELVGNVNEPGDAFLSAGRLAKKGLSPAARRDHGLFFDGKFSLEGSVDSGESVVRGIGPSSPALSLAARTARPAGRARSDQVADRARDVGGSVPSAVPESARAKVNFVDPAIGGAVSQKKVDLMTAPEHAENAVAVAHVIGQLELLSRSGLAMKPRRTDVPSFPSPAGLRPIEYVGYVLEKYRRATSGVFVKEEEIELPGREYSEYVDTRVRYGGAYRYRVRAIVRWTRPTDVGPMGGGRRTAGRASVRSIAPFESSYFGGQWSPRWAYAVVLDVVPPPPPDELVVRPESARRRISVSFRLPEDAQRDIRKMVLLRKTQDFAGRDSTEWVEVADFPPQNVSFLDVDVSFFQDGAVRYVYAAQCVSRRGERSELSEQLGARLNADFKTQGEYSIDFVSCPGVRPEHFGAFSVRPVRRTTSEVVVPVRGHRTSFVLSGRPGPGAGLGATVDYLVRVESLDTGEIRDVPLAVVYENHKARVVEVATNVHVSPRAPRPADPPSVQTATRPIGREAVPPERVPTGVRGKFPPGRAG